MSSKRCSGSKLYFKSLSKINKVKLREVLIALIIRRIKVKYVLSNEGSLYIRVFRVFSISYKKSALFDEIVKLVLSRKVVIIQVNRVRQA